MRFIYWIRRHPLLAAILSFGIIPAPQWLASVWALFSSEPLVPWLMRHHIAHLSFSPWLITIPVGVLMFVGILLVQWKVPLKSGRLRIACHPSIEGCVTRVRWGPEVWANF